MFQVNFNVSEVENVSKELPDNVMAVKQTNFIVINSIGLSNGFHSVSIEHCACELYIYIRKCCIIDIRERIEDKNER